MAAKSEWRPGPTVCRCCLTEGCYKDISTEYFWMGKREVYAEMLKDTLEVTIAYSKAGGPNSNSRLICESCISRLRDATEFKRQVVECERMFMQHLDPGSSSAAIEAETEPVGKIKVEGVKLEKSNSDDDFDNRHAFGDDDDDDDDDLDNQPLTKLASKMPTKESVDLLDLLDNSKTAEKRKSSTKVKPPPPKKAKSKVEQVKVKPSGSKLTPKPEKKKKGGNKTDNKGKRDEETDRYLNLRKNGRKTALVLLQYSNIYPFKWSKGRYMCFYCNHENADLEKFRKHIKDNHNNLGADKLHEASIRLQSYDLIKVDASDVNCKLCDDIIDNLDDLKAHLVNKHEKNIDVKNDGILPFRLSNDEFGCVKCDNTYVELKKLSEHLNVHYKNFICEECGSGFVSVNRLKNHVASHAAKSYPCNTCEKLFTSTTARKHHVSVVHKKIKINRCPHCHETFHSFYKKKQHINTVHGLKIKEFSCDLCPKVFLISGNLIMHKKVVHLNQKRFACEICEAKFYFQHQLDNHMISHGGEKKYECQVCKKCYARPRTLKEHMRIHNNDRRFVCAFCGQAFVQNCSLKQHLKKHLPTQLKEEVI
ncbi:zinc finger protein 26 isoform X11 [Amyelois transitella]|uniref:zinc finger protein 26 isoform X11 n=1 Tax=Amyelois transitella TaxID=680683 RepID=UPI00298F5EA4|nr:zinc finger protein 26 isoform X11 [Amyelois transitella]